jgi:hypothetical protein
VAHLAGATIAELKSSHVAMISGRPASQTVRWRRTSIGTTTVHSVRAALDNSVIAVISKREELRTNGCASRNEWSSAAGPT